eukprot:TRINITY_DN2730_c0_g1_i1.p1 TRINITY_DN2730_c0_g1~~TRINITY_DN2730_c0_g1_i1.p1  ORF type:complete len:377 (+),score=20.03 TRINITY_DN2730_c0_g1_i1:121-1251(+)
MSDTDSSGSSPKRGIRRGLPKKAKKCSVDEFDEREVGQRVLNECIWAYGQKERGKRLLTPTGARDLKDALEQAVEDVIDDLCTSSNGKYSGENLRDHVEDYAEEWEIPKILTLDIVCHEHTVKGPRATNEDRCAYIPDLKLITDSLPSELCSYVAVFDGHNGTDAAETAKHLLHHFITQHLVSVTGSGALDIPEQSVREALIAAYHDMHLAITSRTSWNDSESGTTATTCLVIENYLYTANVGDSKAVLVRDGKAITLTGHHHVSNESEVQSLQSRGGEIVKVRGAPMVNGRTMVTRSLGFTPCQEVLSQVPEITKHSLHPGDLLIAATDGLWDVVSAEEAITFSTSSLTPTETLTSEALRRGSTDNVTVLMMRFK